MKAFTCTLIVVLALAWPRGPAVALDITFDDVVSVDNPLVTMLETYGYRFTGSFRTIGAPGDRFVSNGSAVYLGQEAAVAGITMTRSDGKTFALYEFDAAGLYVSAPGGPPNAQRVGLLGLRIGGDLFHAFYPLSDLPSVGHFSVPGTWHDLQAVTFTGLLASGGPAALALDDVGVGEGPTSVPEPATLALALLTACGGGALALAWRRGHRFARHR